MKKKHHVYQSAVIKCNNISTIDIYYHIPYVNYLLFYIIIFLWIIFIQILSLYFTFFRSYVTYNGISGFLCHFLRFEL